MIIIIIIIIMMMIMLMLLLLLLPFTMFADVFVDVPNEIDLEHLRGRGIQPGEEPLPDTNTANGGADHVVIDENIVAQLMSMGFPRNRCEKAAHRTNNQGRYAYLRLVQDLV